MGGWEIVEMMAGGVGDIRENDGRRSRVGKGKLRVGEVKEKRIWEVEEMRAGEVGKIMIGEIG